MFRFFNFVSLFPLLRFNGAVPYSPEAIQEMGYSLPEKNRAPMLEQGSQQAEVVPKRKRKKRRKKKSKNRC